MKKPRRNRPWLQYEYTDRIMEDWDSVIHTRKRRGEGQRQWTMMAISANQSLDWKCRRKISIYESLGETRCLMYIIETLIFTTIFAYSLWDTQIYSPNSFYPGETVNSVKCIVYFTIIIIYTYNNKYQGRVLTS